MKKYVCYYRVSTRKQGLGLDAQQAICRDYVNSHGGEIIAEYSEKESGKRDDRPEMLKAINFANSNDAIFVVAKIDRLSRGGLFSAAGILEKINNIAVVGLPDLNTLTKGLFLSLAAYERELISERTKQALAEKKRRGAKLGAPAATFTDQQREAALKRRREKAAHNCRQFADLIVMYREKGMTLQAIADSLNAKGFTTPRGKAFAPATIAMYLKREGQDPIFGASRHAGGLWRGWLYNSTAGGLKPRRGTLKAHSERAAEKQHINQLKNDER